MSRVRLALGTVQLGLDYGVANDTGRPSPGEIDRILHAALDADVEYIDTAAAYGDAEIVLGRFFRETGRPDRLRIGTKMSRLPAGLSTSALAREVSAAIDRSRLRLGVAQIDDLLMHDAHNLREYGPALTDVLAGHRQAGRVKRIGLSMYDADDAELALSYQLVMATQFPFNAFHRDLGESGMVARLRESGRETFARSALLQGLLVMPPDRGEAAVPGAGPWLARFRETCDVHGVQPMTAALQYACARSGADFLVVGVESVDQFREISQAIVSLPPQSLSDEIERRFANVPQHVRDPRQWRGAA